MTAILSASTMPCNRSADEHLQVGEPAVRLHVSSAAIINANLAKISPAINQPNFLDFRTTPIRGHCRRVLICRQSRDGVLHEDLGIHSLLSTGAPPLSPTAS